MSQRLSRSLFIWAMIVGLTSGCSIQGSVTDLSPSRSFEADPSEVIGLLPASQHLTVEGYDVSISLESVHAGSRHDVEGYTVFTSLQGQLNSDAESKND